MVEITMKDPRYTQLAQVLTTHSIPVKPEQHIYIQAVGLGALPLACEVVKQAWQKGAHPYLDITDDSLTEYFYSVATKSHLEEKPVIAEFITKWSDAAIIIVADENSRSLVHVDPHKLLQRQKLMKSIREIRLQKPWVLTYVPTHGLAQDAGMSTESFEDFYFNATLRDWETEGKRFSAVAKQLSGAKHIEVKGVDTHLTLSAEGRIFVPDCAEANMPGGEVFTAPVEHSVEGHVYFNYPLLRSGKFIKDIRLWFKKGKIVKATASENENFLKSILDTDKGASFLGEFAIGMNPGITAYMNNMLFDEKIEGTIHMAVGMAYKECGGVNESAIHMDIVKDMRAAGSEIIVDGKMIFKEGKLLIG
jgi:aminopeptidase